MASLPVRLVVSGHKVKEEMKLYGIFDRKIQKLGSTLCYKIKSKYFGESAICKEFIASEVVSKALSISGNFLYLSMFSPGAVIDEPSVVLKKTKAIYLFVFALVTNSVLVNNYIDDIQGWF